MSFVSYIGAAAAMAGVERCPSSAPPPTPMPTGIFFYLCYFICRERKTSFKEKNVHKHHVDTENSDIISFLNFATCLTQALRVNRGERVYRI